MKVMLIYLNLLSGFSLILPLVLKGLEAPVSWQWYLATPGLGVIQVDGGRVDRGLGSVSSFGGV